MSSGSIKRDIERRTWGFVVDVPGVDGKRRQVRRRGFATRKEAEAALLELRQESTTGRRVAGSRRLTVDAYLSTRWLPALAADTKLKPATVAGYRSMAKHLVDGLRGIRLVDLTGDQLTALYGRLRAAKKKERTVRYVHVTAHRALKDACRWRLVGFNAADDADAPAQSRPDPKAWTPRQVGTFLAVALDDRWWPLWRLAATTGMRRGELVGLRWTDVDVKTGAVTVAANVVVVDGLAVEGTPKSGRTRRVALDPVTVDALKAWRAQQATERLAMGAGWPVTDRVFLWADGSALHPDVVTRTFGRLAGKAKLPPLHLHALRHAWATSALLAGVDVKVVADRLGHSSTRITHDIYTAPVTALDERAAVTIAGLYDAPPTVSVTAP